MPVGSSPRLWGTLLVLCFLSFLVRFIPTPVGNTVASAALQSQLPVHPHACGEHISSYSKIYWCVGSSPRLWGTRPICQCRIGILRFIPTPVGNTSSSQTQPSAAAVHPHACGEHDYALQPLPGRVGSSPRLWGTLEFSFSSPDVERFIPTPVGNTPVSANKTSRMPVHPHACGEHSSVDSKVEIHYGSSPRLWGTLCHLPAFDHVLRFIPTPVGNTRGSPAGATPRSVHPHACGEHLG